MALNGRMHGSLSPPERELHNFRAITTVGDRSFLTELLVLVLAVTFAFPSSACGSTAKESTAVSARPDSSGQWARHECAASSQAAAGTGSPSFEVRGVFSMTTPRFSTTPKIGSKDRPALLLNTPIFPLPSCSVRATTVGTMACPPTPTPGSIQLLCTYQC